MEPSKKRDTILVLSDNDEILDKIYSSLGNKFSYIKAVNSVEALSKMTFNIPSLIIADQDISGINILRLLKTIRNGIKTKLIPFITISKSNNQDERIKAIESGVDAFVVYPFNPDELRAVVNSILNKFKEFYLLTITDELTRLYNRKEFIKKFNDEINESKQNLISLSILDIDHFKRINDVYGHQTGDIVLMKLASTLKDYSSKSFFPARFGGEEFVILFPGIKLHEATYIMKKLLKDFSSIEFVVNNKVFHVAFSAGISEYPSMGNNISELLSRADQALYAAKNDGRNLVYTFNPIMARNDKFWEFLKTRKEMYVDSHSYDGVTQLPYLPQLLDIVSNLDFEVQSIGVLVLSFKNITESDSFSGFKNNSYDIENINRIISRSTELIFPSDNYIGISDFYKHEFIILFPSVVDFSFNIVKFKEICKEISMVINENVKYFPLDLSHSSDVSSLNAINPRKIFNDISHIRSNPDQLSDKMRVYSAYQKSFKNISKIITIKDFIKLKDCYDTGLQKKSYHYFSLKKPFEYINLFSQLINEQIDTQKKLKEILHLCARSFNNKITNPLLFPYIHKMDTAFLIKALLDEFAGKNIILMINEYQLQNLSQEYMLSLMNYIPENISLGIDNCYISNEILNILSKYNFSILSFSENITRNLYMFKNRIKIVSGLTIFLDQISVPSIAYNIHLEEEFQIINDLNIKFCSGLYPEQHYKTKKKLSH